MWSRWHHGRLWALQIRKQKSRDISSMRSEGWRAEWSKWLALKMQGHMNWNSVCSLYRKVSLGRNQKCHQDWLALWRQCGQEVRPEVLSEWLCTPCRARYPGWIRYGLLYQMAWSLHLLQSQEADSILDALFSCQRQVCVTAAMKHPLGNCLGPNCLGWFLGQNRLAGAASASKAI